MIRHLVVNIHGIHTGKTEPNWTAHLGLDLQESVDDLECIGEHYPAGAFAPWTHWVVNPREAEALANRIALVELRNPGVKVYLVAHSNGTNIAMLVAERLAAMGIGVEVMILIGSAIESDIDKSGIADLLADRTLRRAIAYCSDADVVIGWSGFFPGFWGDLGTEGFRRKGESIGLQLDGYERIPSPAEIAARSFPCRLVTRWFPGYGHSTALNPPKRAETFRCIRGDLGLG